MPERMESSVTDGDVSRMAGALIAIMGWAEVRNHKHIAAIARDALPPSYPESSRSATTASDNNVEPYCSEGADVKTSPSSHEGASNGD